MTLLGDNGPAVDDDRTSRSDVELLSIDCWSSDVTERPSSASSRSRPETPYIDKYTPSGTKSKLLYLRIVTSSIMDQFKEIQLLESLLNFQKDACRPDICHIPSKCYHFTLQNGKQCKNASRVLQITGSNTLISTCVE